VLLPVNAPTTRCMPSGGVPTVVWSVGQVYRANEHPKFPEGGKMSQHLDALPIGSEIQVKGPIGHFVYKGRGAYTMHNKHHGTATHLSMVAGGTGG
jgi:nitrate reductase (NAD(P)H)